MRRKPIYMAACVLAAVGLVLIGCDSSPTGLEPCEPFAFGPTLPGAGLTPASLVPVLDDAANRVVPVLVDAGATLQLKYAVQAVSAAVYSGDVEGTCRAFNDAAAELAEFSTSAPPASLPDLVSLRVALGLAHAWISGPESAPARSGVSQRRPNPDPAQP